MTAQVPLGDPARATGTRIGVVGAGRVGAVLAAALRAAGHQVVAVAGDSDASRNRAETLLPGVPRRKPTAVSRSCDLLLLTVPDDMLSNVVTQLAASGDARQERLGAGAGGVRVARDGHDLVTCGLEGRG